KQLYRFSRTLSQFDNGLQLPRQRLEAPLQLCLRIWFQPFPRILILSQTVGSPTRVFGQFAARNDVKTLRRFFVCDIDQEVGPGRSRKIKREILCLGIGNTVLTQACWDDLAGSAVYQKQPGIVTESPRVNR